MMRKSPGYRSTEDVKCGQFMFLGKQGLPMRSAGWLWGAIASPKRQPRLDK